MFGDNLLPSLVLALGAALALGTLLALVRPPKNPADGALDRPPLARSVVQIVIGSVAAIWATASMLS
jgi:hypothetical protein